MFREDLLLIIRKYYYSVYSNWCTLCIYVDWLLAGSGWNCKMSIGKIEWDLNRAISAVDQMVWFCNIGGGQAPETGKSRNNPFTVINQKWNSWFKDWLLVSTLWAHRFSPHNTICFIRIDSEQFCASSRSPVPTVQGFNINIPDLQLPQFN
jgi:hypothetical protein